MEHFLSVFVNKYRFRLVLLLSMIFVLMVSVCYANDKKQYIKSEKEDTILITLIDNGYSLAGACGVLGNISVENPKFQPDLEANGGLTYGLFQWNDVGGRRKNLVKWCNNRKLYPNRMEGQLAFAMHELQGGDPIAERLDEYLKNTDDAEKAAMEFAAGFERCIGSTGNDDIDGTYTGTVYPERYGKTYQALNKRVANASDYYDVYSESVLNPDLALEIKIVPTTGIVGEQEDYIFDKSESIFVVNDANVTNLQRVLSVLICLIIGYLCGNVLGAAVIFRAIKHKSIYTTRRKLPSLVNVARYIGVKESLLSLIIDVAKFYVAMGLSYLCTRGVLHSEMILWVGLGIILGNDFPFWAKFKGSMGIVATLTLLCIYMPLWGVVCLIGGAIIALLSKSFPQGAIFMSVLAVPYAFKVRGFAPGIIITLVMVIMLIRHYKTVIEVFDKTIIQGYYNLKRASRPKVMRVE